MKLKISPFKQVSCCLMQFILLEISHLRAIYRQFLTELFPTPNTILKLEIKENLCFFYWRAVINGDSVCFAIIIAVIIIIKTETNSVSTKLIAPYTVPQTDTTNKISNSVWHSCQTVWHSYKRIIIQNGHTRPNHWHSVCML